MSFQQHSSIPAPPSDCIPVRIQINRKDIVYMHGIIEAYDDLAVVRTIDKNQGIIELLASPSYLKELMQLLDALSEEIELRVLSE